MVIIGALYAAFWLGWATLSLPLVMLAARENPAALIGAAMLHIALQTFAQTVVWRLSMNMRVP